MAVFGLIGNPVSHSRSPQLFNEWFRGEGLGHKYELFPLEDIAELPSLLREQPGIAGLNVTYPFKEAVVPMCLNADPVVLHCRAANTLLIRREARNLLIEGYNTDAEGFRMAFGDLIDSKDKVLVIGTGGAARAVEYSMRNAGNDVTLISRNPGAGQSGYDDLDSHMIGSHRVIVQATPLGMHRNEDSAPPFPFGYLTERHLAIDLIYSPGTTLFMRRSMEMKARAINGLEMLKKQAWLSYRIWMDAIS